MKSTSYKIKLRGIVGNITAIPKSIAWINGSDTCLLTPCYKENDYIVVELIPDCVGSSCIEGYIQFGDTCATCEPLYFKRCFCTTDEDCPTGCENCNQYGICQSKCLIGEFCVGDACCECNDTIPCTGNKICNGCKCVCPQGTFDKDGICVECDQNTVLDKCHVCVNGTIVAVPCDGACDPTTGGCVDCLVGGDCSSRTDGKTCCINKQCVCCTGTIWDPTLKTCVPQPCVSDEACGDPCLKCTPEGCKPIVCPAGYKCYKGECVEWPCASTSCDNGADCGPNCGCVIFEGIKQCVPCAILECEGLCELALGCKCNENKKCVGLDNCNDYCDGETACSDPNCTCYNNRCVSCENFPCDPNDCSSRQNCGCVNGDCEGGQGCKDKLELIKACGTNKSDCKLTAKLIMEKPCKCDDIRFETENLFTCTPSQNLIKLKVNLFKGQVPYNNFNDLTIGDNELIEGIISTKITHYDNKGVILDLGTTPISDKPIILNSVQEIDILKNTNFKINYPTSNSVISKGVKVKIEVIAKDIKVPNNDCIAYKNETIIASYTLDFTNIVNENQICTVINNSIALEKAYINDKTSLKRPLFVWSKSATDFPTTQYDNNGNYDNKGWFRKQYGVKTSTGWEDILSTVDEGLVNNYNYVVKTDCGCAKLAVHNRLDFCCLPDITPEFTECNVRLNIPSFKVCEINGDISDASIPDFNKAYYKLEIDHNDSSVVKDILFNTDNVSTLAIRYKNIDKGIIKSAKIIRYFKGGLLQDVTCDKILELPIVNIPEIVYNTECLTEEFKYNVTVNQVVNNIKVLTATFIKKNKITGQESSTNQTITMGNSSQKSITIPIKTGITGPTTSLNIATEDLYMIVTFEGGCTEKYLLPVCEKKTILTSVPDIYSGRICTSPTTGPSVEVTAIGFTENVQYSINNSAYQTSNVFTNLDPGTYNVKTRDIINEVETIVEDNITIEPKMDTQVSLSPPSLCAGQSSILTIIGEPNKSFTIKAPNGATLTANATTNAQGIYTYPNLTVAGDYTVISNNISTKFCNTNKKVTLSTGGETLYPTITFQAGSYCVGQPIPFRIFDNGKNRTYNVITTNGSITTPLQATDTGFNGEYIPSSTIGSITIQSSTSSCDTMIPVTTSTPTTGVTITTGPVIGTPNVSCVSGLHTVVVNVTGATSVTIGGVTITPSGTTYTRTGITGTSNIDIIATNGSCSVTTPVVLQNCDCPDYSATIGISAATCGQGSQTIFFTGYTPNLIGVNYQLQEFSLGQWWNVVGEDGIFAEPTPEFTINNQINNPKSYRVIFNDGVCTKETDFVTTSATQNPIISIIASVPNNVPTNTIVNLQAIGGTPGITTYSWTGLSATGQTSSNVDVSFTTPGNYTYSVTATTGGCVTIANYEVIVQNTCTNPPTISGITNLGTCQNPTANNPIGGIGAYTYEWSVDGGVTTLANTLILDGSLISAGATETLTFIITDSTGCSSTYTATYTRCATGCNCQYSFNITDSVTGLTDLSTYTSEILDQEINLVFTADKTISKTCTGLATINTVTSINMLSHSILGATTVFAGTMDVTSMDLIDNGVPVTLAIPISYAGGNPRSSWFHLAEFLNDTLTGVGTFTYNASGLRCQLGSTITKGFNYASNFTNNGNSVSYSRVVTSPSDATLIHSIPCGSLIYSYNYPLVALPTITVTSLSTVTIVGAYVKVRTTPTVSNNGPITCSNCN